MDWLFPIALILGAVLSSGVLLVIIAKARMSTLNKIPPPSATPPSPRPSEPRPGATVGREVDFVCFREHLEMWGDE